MLPREDLTLANRRFALAEHRAAEAEDALQEVAELLRDAPTMKALRQLVARIKELIASHTTSPSKG